VPQPSTDPPVFAGLGKDGKLEFHKAMPQLMTSWRLLYRALRTAFLAEDYVEGDVLLSFKSTKRKATCHFAKCGEIECDLLVGVDGSRSFVSLTLFPEVQPRYAGYVAWHGVVAESEAGCDLLETFADHFTLHLRIFFCPSAG
jgi:2-polyprenyl-6-methoxyphenol hydroxylase-like FAD-dependent oxidoreductase